MKTAGMCAAAALLGLAATAQAAMTGTEIVQKSRDLYQGVDQRSTVTLELINSDGSTRKIVTKRLWKDFKGDQGYAAKTVFFTLFPPDSKGVGFLIWDTSDPKQQDKLWLYLPSLKQVRKVSVRDQDDAFMGSDLTFADMGQRLLEEDAHTLVGDETLDGKGYFIVESVPVSESIYGKKRLWISKDDHTTLKIEYYDRKNELLKVQDITWIRDGNMRVYKQLDVKNVQTNHRTIYTITDLETGVGLGDRDFSDRGLTRGYRE
ncbi:MAG: outer membrane lipoprotein-sorting protein [Nitrospirae bacterium]|nr:outer membrane lipoprotein-sorting protein [Nitrospirota bacterium]